MQQSGWLREGGCMVDAVRAQLNLVCLSVLVGRPPPRRVGVENIYYLLCFDSKRCAVWNGSVISQ